MLCEAFFYFFNKNYQDERLEHPAQSGMVPGSHPGGTTLKGITFGDSFSIFNMAVTYILYSKQINKFYIGATHDEIETRLMNHNTSKYGGKSYTSKTNDWELKLAIEAIDYSHAVRIERKIKSMKSRKYIESLINSVEMIERLKKQTTST